MWRRLRGKTKRWQYASDYQTDGRVHSYQRFHRGKSGGCTWRACQAWLRISGRKHGLPAGTICKDSGRKQGGSFRGGYVQTGKPTAKFNQKADRLVVIADAWFDTWIPPMEEMHPNFGTAFALKL